MVVFLSAHTEGTPPLQTPACERAGQAGQEALWVSQGSSACMTESLARVLWVCPGTEAGRKFQGKYIFYAVQSKSSSPLSQFAPVSIQCLGRAWLLRNLRCAGCTGVLPRAAGISPVQKSLGLAPCWAKGSGCCRDPARFTSRVRAQLPQSQVPATSWAAQHPQGIKSSISSWEP